MGAPHTRKEEPMNTSQVRRAVLDYINTHPHCDACDIALALGISVHRAFAIVDTLIAEGEVKIAGTSN